MDTHNLVTSWEPQDPIDPAIAFLINALIEEGFSIFHPQFKLVITWTSEGEQLLVAAENIEDLLSKCRNFCIQLWLGDGDDLCISWESKIIKIYWTGFSPQQFERYFAIVNTIAYRYQSINATPELKLSVEYES
jgi:hypothetical protein